MSRWVEVRHLHLVEGVPKKEIARRLKLDEPLAKLPGDWGWAQSSALLVNTIALDRRLDILSG